MFSWILLLAALLFSPPHVVLITIDGVRYQEVFQGTDPDFYHGAALSARELVPNLYHYFVDGGIAVGKLTPMIASGPNFISLPGYLEITRGHPSTDCRSNFCRPHIDRSILQLYNNSAVFSSWSGIARTIPTNYHGYADIGSPYRWDANTEQIVNTYLSNHQPDFLWVSLGDTDEYGHANNYPAYLQALQGADAFIGQLISRFDNNTIFIVTVDHGRNANFRDHGLDPHSRRVWCMLYGKGIPAMGLVTADKVSLSNIYPTIVYFQSGIPSPNSLLYKIH